MADFFQACPTLHMEPRYTFADLQTCAPPNKEHVQRESSSAYELLDHLVIPQIWGTKLMLRYGLRLKGDLESAGSSKVAYLMSLRGTLLCRMVIN